MSLMMILLNLTWLSWWNIHAWQVNRSLLTSNSLQLSPACLKHRLVAGMVYGLTRSARISPFVKETEPNVMRQDPEILKLLIQSRCSTGLSSVFVFTILAFPQNPRTLCRRIPMLETPQLPVSIASPIWEDSAKHLAVEVYIFFGQTTLELSQNEVHRKINHAFPTFDGRKLEGIPPCLLFYHYPKLLHFL